MKEIYPKILDEMDSRKLVEIIKLGKYKLRGFRLEGKNNLQKRNAMIRELLNANNLDLSIKKYAGGLVKEDKIDNMWTFPNNLNVSDIVDRIESYPKERVFLELLSNGKEELIKEYYIHTKKEEASNDEPDQSQVTNNVDIDSLRQIIRNLEQDNKKKTDAKSIVDMENQRLKKEIDKLKDIIDRQKVKDIDTIKNLSSRDSKIIELKEELTNMKNEFNEYKIEQEFMKDKVNFDLKIKILIVGKNVPNDWFQYMNKQGLFHFVFEHSEDQGAAITIDEVWLIRSFLSNSQLKIIEESDHFIKMKNILRTRYFKDFYEIEGYMLKLEELYYDK